MSEKTPHLVFQVINFIYSPEIHNYNLLEIDKLILILLAKRSGKSGIHPSLLKMSVTLGKSYRYIKNRIKVLVDKKLITLTARSGKSHLYGIVFLSSNPASTDHGYPETDPASTDADTQHVQYQDPASTDATIRTNRSVHNIRTERARTKRAPLPLHWQPSEKLKNMAVGVGQKSGKTAPELLTKFRNLQISKQNLSADWSCEFENFLLNERPAVWGVPSLKVKEEPRCTVPEYGPGHPTWEMLRGKH